MSQYNQIVKKVIVPSGGGAFRVWDQPHGAPYKNLTIIVKSTSANSTNITEEVFFGGYFTSGGNVVPAYTEGSTHTGGLSQGAAAAIGTSSVECAYTVFTHAGILPENNPNSELGPMGFPVVLELKNSNTAPVELEVIFISESLSSLVRKVR